MRKKKQRLEVVSRGALQFSVSVPCSLMASPTHPLTHVPRRVTPIDASAAAADANDILSRERPRRLLDEQWFCFPIPGVSPTDLRCVSSHVPVFPCSRMLMFLDQWRMAKGRYYFELAVNMDRNGW